MSSEDYPNIRRSQSVISWAVASLYVLTVTGYALISTLPVILNVEGRLITIPYRIFVAALAVGIVFFSPRTPSGTMGKACLPLIVFWACYLVRLVSDTVIYPISL